MLPLLRFTCTVLLLVMPLLGWAQANDGFQRRDGTMYLIRNGEIRPMPHDVQLPNGRLITRDGFVVQRDGSRTELPDGEGCTLLGELASVGRGTNGRLQLASPNGAPRGQVLLMRWPGPPGWAKGHGKGHGKHKGRKHGR
ncbi:DUF6799 domain-containing protein [Hymenobacter pini]|uniref:DUF6799 domain-containing protein n=1 Tax=Hymenobacter pini TaxID=2880879 RepID=UPI001CF43FAD|nr:DUF6799 domain-containing protein [Hymenobacter pini]MCA8833086.1 hypothetical protein [Hymenobacter pini]